MASTVSHYRRFADPSRRRAGTQLQYTRSVDETGDLNRRIVRETLPEPVRHGLPVERHHVAVAREGAVGAV